MKIVKYHLGVEEPHSVEMNDFKNTTKETFPFAQTVNGEKSAFAFCPKCNNSVRLLGIYKPIQGKQGAHARHTKTDVPGFPTFDEKLYLWCPFHRKKANYIVEVTREDVTKEDLEILNLALENFDRCIYLIKAVLGLVISDSFAEEILKDYISKRGYMTYDRTTDNIPWIMLIDMPPIKIWNRLIMKDSPLYNLLKRNGVSFLQTENETTVRVKKDNYISVTTGNYRFKVDENDIFHEYATISAIKPDGRGTYYAVDDITIELLPFAFNKMINSSKKTFRKKSLLDMAKRYIPKK